MADKQLEKVRTKFIDQVSKVVLCQLLDGLLEDYVLNDGETEAIVEKNFTRADQARDLIDTVKKKGDCASRRMITHLKSRDPHFFVTLGLILEDPTETKEQSWSETLQTTTPTFWIAKQNNPDNYLVTKESIRNRVALLITNIEFTFMTRRGAEKDEENMEILLRGLGYDVVKYRDLTAEGIDDALSCFSNHPKLKETDSVFVVIMSLGECGFIYGCDAKLSPGEKQSKFPIDNIYKHLGTRNCPLLENKPKVIIIEGCRGEGTEFVFVRNENAAVTRDDVPQSSQQPSAEGGNVEDDSWQLKHNEKDFTSLLSCAPGTMSYRHVIKGSIMIQSAVKVFNTFACKKHIEELFTLITHDVAEFSCGRKMQMPTKERHTLLKNFYLYPGV